MNTELINNAINAFKNFVAACGNDVCAESEGEYTVFSGQISADQKGNIKTYALINDKDSEEPKKILVAQIPLRSILDRGADFGISMVDLYQADKAEAAKKADAEAAAEAEAAEVYNKDIEDKSMNFSQRSQI